MAEETSELQGATVTANGESVGTVATVYTHAGDDRAAVVGVETGDGERLVPLPDGTTEVPFAAGLVASAPRAEGDSLLEADFEAVYDHYGIDDADMRSQDRP